MRPVSVLNALAYLYPKPSASAQIRTQPDDFCVTEQLGFAPSGEGEHVFLRIQKTGENTDWVAKQLAKFADVRPHDVAYAGKKDRHAVTEQWFSVWLPGNQSRDWQAFETETIKVLEVTRHSRKLKLGVLEGNQFQLTLRNVTHADDIIERAPIVARGVPNYFGPQRFGINGANLEKGERLLRQEYREKNRNKRGLYLSAVRSHLFNLLISERLTQQTWGRVALGDALMLDGSQSCFVVEASRDEAQQRLDKGEVHLTGPLWGRGRLLTQGEVAQWESALYQRQPDLCDGLEKVGMNQERRSLRLVPKGLKAEKLDNETVRLSFFLPAGCFATSVLRELCDASDNNEN
ncbi:MAG: tRNA pseudouridine(13) synthase TruD [Pontibacterium sp.]